ncbi:MAG: hypothetical protein NT045_01910, partial [Candidatus Aureabacteria bacterium]|nr:hypothetical protein [Candidatus Auribacterota bacterium]
REDRVFEKRGRRYHEAGGGGVVSRVTIEMVRRNTTVNSYLAKTDRCMVSMGYTEHGARHARMVSISTSTTG